MKARLFLNEQYRSADGTFPVVLRVSSKAARKYHPTGVSVGEQHWNPAERRIRKSHPRHLALNRKLAALEAKAEQLILENRAITIAGLLSKLDGGPPPLEGTFTSMARQLIEREPPKAWHTLKTWSTILDKMDRLVPGLLIEDVGPKSMRRYMAACIADGNTAATPSNNIRQIRAMYRRICREVGRTPVVVTTGLTIVESNTPPRYVPRDRIMDVLTYPAGPKDRLALDLWTFSFECCGLRYTDAALLTWAQVDGGWLNIAGQHKTGYGKNVKLTVRALSILERYKGGKNVFKILGDRKTDEAALSAALVTINKTLRRIGKDLNLPHPLTTHTARHTWTEWALSVNMPLPDIKRQLGLKSWKSFEAYIAKFNPQVAQSTSDRMDMEFAPRSAT
jgi:integrase